MSEKIFVKGIRIKNAKKNWFELKVSLCYEDIVDWMKANKEHANESKGGKHYFNLMLKESKQESQYGDTHYMELNTWKPDNQQAPEVPPAVQEVFPEGKVVDKDDIPF